MNGLEFDSEPRKTLANRILDNLTNGNLADAKRLAKRLAKRIGYRRLRVAARERWPVAEADAAAGYCKGYVDWQEYCDTTASVRNASKGGCR